MNFLWLRKLSLLALAALPVAGFACTLLATTPYRQALDGQNPSGGSKGSPLKGHAVKLTAAKKALIKSTLIASLPTEYVLEHESDPHSFPVVMLRFKKTETVAEQGIESIDFRFSKYDSVKSAEAAVRRTLYQVQGTNGKSLREVLKYGLPEGRPLEGFSFYVADEVKGSMILTANLGSAYAEVRFSKAPTLSEKGEVVYAQKDFRAIFKKIIDSLAAALQAAQ